MASKKGIALQQLSPARAAEFTVPLTDISTGLRPILEQHGCAIVTGVASPEECAHLEACFGTDLRELVDVDALKGANSAVKGAADAALCDVSAWPVESLQLLGEKERCQLRGLPHGRFSWACRLLPGVRRCYEAIHATSDLVSSCDNPFFAPASHAEQHVNRSWPHVDHNSNDRRFCDDEGQTVGDWEVYQGLLYIWSSEHAHSSTTAVMPGSHQDAYEAIMRDPGVVQRGRKGNHFTLISHLSNKRLAASLQDQWNREAGRVCVPPGGLLLWSSRTLHQGWSGGPRLAQPVCWEPSTRRSDAALDRKLRLAALGLPSTHWASLGIPHYLVAPEPCAPTGAHSSGTKVFLPMKSSLQPISLQECSHVSDMWERLQGCDATQPLPGELRKLVAESLSENVRAAL